MKKLIINLILFLFLSTFLLAQNIPQGMSYQAVARDADGQLLSNTPISLRIALISNIERRGVAYSEIHNVTTNEFGVFDFVIGQGESLSGNFEEIPWELEEIWLEVALDEKAGADFKIMNTTKLLSVPYAFHAGSATRLVPINPNGDGRVPWWGMPWWNVQGLEGTDPDKHFVGNIDPVDLVFRTDNLHRMRIKANGDIDMNGDVTIESTLNVDGATYLHNTLDVDGMATVMCLKILGGCDIKEDINSIEVLEPGDIVVIDDKNPGNIIRTNLEYDRKVAGVISGANGINPGLSLSQKDVLEGDHPLTMLGRVYVKVSGKVEIGDMLTTSQIPGYAMAVKDFSKAHGAVIGKAMTANENSLGLVLILVNLQ